LNKALVALLLIASLIIGVVIAATLQYSLTIPSIGTIKGVGVSIQWLNGSECNTINWGLRYNDTVYTLPDVLNITNTNNTACTLSLATENLSPNILSLSLTWNYAGSPLQPQEWQLIALTQRIAVANHMSPFFSKTFTYDIIIIATEVAP